jgi:hypothetical protein
MNNNKLSNTYVSLLLISSCINILVCINIFPIDALRGGLFVILLVNIINGYKEENIKEKKKKMTGMDWLILVIWSITFLTGAFIKWYP